ncbi:MAG: hypothetical protein M1822_005223 [Bathelium mastoideum]|nr:MAG: hypothetical protein M1822_005223 [Bathelium mastoideum]
MSARQNSSDSSRPGGLANANPHKWQEAIEDLQKARDAHEAAKKACEDAAKAIQDTYEKLSLDIERPSSADSQKLSSSSIRSASFDQRDDSTLCPTQHTTAPSVDCETASTQQPHSLPNKDDSGGDELLSNDSRYNSGQHPRRGRFSDGEDPRLAPFIPRFYY